MNYPENTVVHPLTEEESRLVGEKIQSMGGKNLHSSVWDYYKDKGCHGLDKVTMHANMYGSLQWYQDHDYNIITAAEFLGTKVTNAYPIW